MRGELQGKELDKDGERIIIMEMVVAMAVVVAMAMVDTI